MLTASIQTTGATRLDHGSAPLIDAPASGPIGMWGSLGETIRRLSCAPSADMDMLPALERVFALSAPGWIRQTRLRLRINRVMG